MNHKMLRDGIVLIGHPRSGSTTLRNVLNFHDMVGMLNEPFNPTRGPLGWGVDYLGDFEQHKSLARSLDLIAQTHPSVKHLLGQLSPELDFEIFKGFKRRVFIVRRNQLKAIVSTLIADQTNLWHLRGQPRQTQTINAVSLKHVRNFLDWQRSAISDFRQAAEALELEFMEVVYEDIFENAKSSVERYAGISSLLDYVDLCPIHRDETLLNVYREFDHDANKVNSIATYMLVPNVAEIEKEFASDANGSLFEL